MESGSSAAKRMVVCSSEDKSAQVSTYRAVKQETPLPDDPVSRARAGYALPLVKKVFLGLFHCSTYSMSPWAALEDVTVTTSVRK